MKTRPRRQRAAYDVINRFSISQNWDGSPLTLNPNDNANMQQTNTGSLVFAYLNLSEQNNQGTLSLTSGGSQPLIFNVMGGAMQPSIYVHNWQGSNLSVTNISPPSMSIPIWIEAAGLGLPGQSCVTLPGDGTSIPLATMQCASGKLTPRWMQLVLQANSGDLTIFAIMGGPQDASGNNAYVISVNDAVNGNTGPGTGKQPPPGYYATSASNYFTFQLNWGGSTIFVVNMSAVSADVGLVQLRPL